MNRLLRTKSTYYVGANGAERVLRVIVAPLRGSGRWSVPRRQATADCAAGARGGVSVPTLWRLTLVLALAWLAVLTIHFAPY